MPQENPVDLSVVLVHYHTEELLRTCLESLFKSLAASGKSHEVFVVDNGSMDFRMAPVLAAYPQVRWIKNTANEGFAKACNQGLRPARGKYCLLLNPDCAVPPTFVGRILQKLDADSGIGIAGGRHLSSYGRLQPSARRFPTLWNVLADQLLLTRLFPHSRWLNSYRMGGFSHDHECEVDQLMGSCLIVRRAVLDQIGYLDERFFLYFEEVDLCWRAKRAGWKIVFFPDMQIQVVHVGGASSRQHLSERYIQRYHSLCLWYRKYFRWPKVVAIKIIILAGLMMRIVVFWLRGNSHRLRAHAEALKKWPLF